MGANRGYGVLIGLGISLGLSACVHFGTGRSGRATPPAQPGASAPSAQPAAEGPAGRAAEPPPTTTSQPPSAVAQSTGASQPPAAPQPAEPKGSKRQSHPPAAVNRRHSPKSQTPSAAAPSAATPSAATPSAPAGPAAPATPKSETPPGAAASTGAGQPGSLDLNSLEQRLRDTHAIGVFTKLSLKNQVDDLLAEFRAFHNKQPGKNLMQLRQQYDTLLLKVLSLLQDGDPSLAAAISSSREAIWGILTDPQKFSKI